MHTEDVVWFVHVLPVHGQSIDEVWAGHTAGAHLLLD